MQYAKNETVTSRILCIGNRFVDGDRGGPEVYRNLAEMKISRRVEVVDGGLAGLNLLGCLEDIATAVFVDNVSGFLSEPGIIVLKLPSEQIAIDDYGHEASVSYLMSVAPQVLDSPMPHCFLVGIDGPPDAALCQRAARISLQIAETGRIKQLEPGKED
jgi:hydrogenase maturation protease